MLNYDSHSCYNGSFVKKNESDTRRDFIVIRYLFLFTGTYDGGCRTDRKLQEQKADMEFLEQFYSLNTLKDLSTGYKDRVSELKGINLSYAYGDTEVLKSYDIILPDKGLILVKGESGKGKSTLLKCMSGLLQVKDGEFYLNSTKIEREELFRICVYEPQDPVLCSDMKENFKNSKQ